MKIGHIIAIVVIALAIGIMVTTAGDASSYVDFGLAQEMAKDGIDKKIHVVGHLNKNAAGKPYQIVYEPAINPNFLQFTLVDEKNTSMTVVYSNPMPQDFERSEKIVIIGAVKNGVFVADKILMKCPSKYQEQEIKTT